MRKGGYTKIVDFIWFTIITKSQRFGLVFQNIDHSAFICWWIQVVQFGKNPNSSLSFTIKVSKKFYLNYTLSINAILGTPD